MTDRTPVPAHPTPPPAQPSRSNSASADRRWRRSTASPDSRTTRRTSCGASGPRKTSGCCANRSCAMRCRSASTTRAASPTISSRGSVCTTSSAKAGGARRSTARTRRRRSSTSRSCNVRKERKTRKCWRTSTTCPTTNLSSGLRIRPPSCRRRSEALPSMQLPPHHDALIIPTDRAILHYQGTTNMMEEPVKGEGKNPTTV
mmetsp:Transcript_23423/g.65371  ORF Transcript_23423/g.65371 Transcript_23423/m.65371 type:complete len:202 (-) Transcript_23423:450-1055(-)